MAQTHTVGDPVGSVDQDALTRLLRPETRFPVSWAVPVAAATLYDAVRPGVLLSRRSVGGCIAEGSSFFVTVSPGSVRIKRRDLGAAERSHEKVEARHRKLADEGAAWAMGRPGRAAAGHLADGGLIDQADVPDDTEDPLGKHKGRSRITEWSAKSRANMTARLLTLDYAPLLDGAGVLAMATLTMPSAWESIAPTGADFKRLVRRFQKRYARAWLRELVGVWKLEFQDRGAPHLHMLIAPPAGLSKCGRTWRAWYSETWADVLGVTGRARADVIFVHSRDVACADYREGMRCTDPARIAVYFTKHGLLANKEYQHVVPRLWRAPGAGPGRFWGVWGLEAVEESVEVTFEQAVRLARVARRWQRAGGRPERDELGAAVRPALHLDRDKPKGSVQGCVEVLYLTVPTRIASAPRSKVRGIPFGGKASGLGVPEQGDTQIRRTHRKIRRRVRRMRGTWGFLAANDGPALALMLAAAVQSP